MPIQESIVPQNKPAESISKFPYLTGIHPIYSGTTAHAQYGNPYLIVVQKFSFHFYTPPLNELVYKVPIPNKKIDCMYGVIIDMCAIMRRPTVADFDGRVRKGSTQERYPCIMGAWRKEPITPCLRLRTGS